MPGPQSSNVMFYYFFVNKFKTREIFHNISFYTHTKKKGIIHDAKKRWDASTNVGRTNTKHAGLRKAIYTVKNLSKKSVRFFFCNIILKQYK